MALDSAREGRRLFGGMPSIKMIAWVAAISLATSVALEKYKATRGSK